MSLVSSLSDKFKLFWHLFVCMFLVMVACAETPIELRVLSGLTMGTHYMLSAQSH